MTRAGEPTRFRLEAPLLSLVLRPYKESCRYLLEVDLEHPPLEALPEGGDWSKGQMTAHGRFSIPASCYIESTGHFNAVEFNICINQLTYAITAYAVEHRLLSLFGYMDRHVFARDQLAKMVIIDYHASFRRPIAADDFRGQVTITGMRERKDIVFMRTKCSFHGRDDGLAKGEILFAALK